MWLKLTRYSDRNQVLVNMDNIVHIGRSLNKETFLWPPRGSAVAVCETLEEIEAMIEIESELAECGQK